MEIQFDAQGVPFVEWGGNVIKLEKEPLTKDLVHKAQEELRETPEIRKQALEELRQLLKGDEKESEEHLPSLESPDPGPWQNVEQLWRSTIVARLRYLYYEKGTLAGETSLVIPLDSDDFLLKFLRPCKFYPESAFKRIQLYYKFRLSHKDYCRDLTPSAIRAAFDHSIVSILAPRDQYGRRIMLVESGERWNPREVPLAEVFRGVQLGLESAMVEPRTQVAGVVTIFDMKGLSFSHVMQFTPSFAKMVVDWIQDCVPIRLKAIHIVSQPYIFNMVFALFKPFLREKLRKRIHFHGNDINALVSHIGRESLRARHGGTLPDPEIPGAVQWKMLHHYEDDFKLANSFGYVNNNNK